MEDINKVVEEGGTTAKKITKFILIVMTCVGTIIGAYFGLKEDIMEKKPISVEQIDSIIVDSIPVDSISHGTEEEI